MDTILYQDDLPRKSVKCNKFNWTRQKETRTETEKAIVRQTLSLDFWFAFITVYQHVFWCGKYAVWKWYMRFDAYLLVVYIYYMLSYAVHSEYIHYTHILNLSFPLKMRFVWMYLIMKWNEKKTIYINSL